MTSQVWMIAITVIYVLAMMALSWYIGKKTTKDETEFMVGGREFTPLMTAVGNGSILISGGYLPSIIMYGYMFGMGGMWFYLGWGTGALVACIMAGLMAATMSTCDIYLVSGVNQLVRDVAQYFLKIRDTKKLLQWAKWGTIIYGMASVAFAIFWKGGLSYLFAFGTGVGAPLFVYYLDSWLLRVGNQAGAISSVAVSMGIVLYWDILTKNSAQVNSLWLIFPASFITLVVVSLLTKKDNVKPVSDKGPDAVQLEILKAMKRGYTNAGAIITSMTQYSNDHELQAGHIHTALDSLEKSGYVTRKGQRLIAQLYFSLTEKGEATAVAHMGASELDTIAKYGVDTRALEFMQWIKSGDVSLSDISGKHSIYMMELSAISEHLSELGLVNVFGQGRLKASLTDAGQKLLQK